MVRVGVGRSGLMENEFLSTGELAKLLHRESQTLRVWRTLGQGPRFMRTGDGPFSRVLYSRKDVEDWLAQRTFHSTSEERAKLDRKEAAEQKGGAK
jgi:DNA-binding transcriptional MerR regulator